MSLCQQGACGGRGVCLKGPGDICGGLGDQYGVCGAGLVCSSCNRCEGTIIFSFHESCHLFIRWLKCQQEAAAASIYCESYLYPSDSDLYAGVSGARTGALSVLMTLAVSLRTMCGSA